MTVPVRHVPERDIRARAVRVLDGGMAVATLFCPLFLLHGRGIAEGLVDAVAAGLLLRGVLGGGFGWMRVPWVGMAALWWGWLLVCSVPAGPFGIGGWSGFGQAAATVRFLLFAAALQHVVLRDPRRRRWMAGLVMAAAGYIATQMLLQAATGHNLWGQGRFHDGTLTGPYGKPRAAAPLSRLLLPTVLWAASVFAVRAGTGPSWRAAGAAVLPLLGGMAVMVLAGQRMPLLLFGLGLVAAGVMLPRLRPVLGGVLLLAPVLVALSAVLTPASFHHLVLLFAQQMGHFRQSSYGLVFARSAAIGWNNPGTGLGFDGFRHGCADPAYFRGWPPWGSGTGEGGAAAICVQHPHNHYLQALVDAGLPGLGLFCALVLTWLRAAGWGLWRGAEMIGAWQGAAMIDARRRAGVADARRRAWRVGLFAAVFIQEWPIASSSAFTNMPLGGWFFLLLGMALAEADADMRDGMRVGDPAGETGMGRA